MKQLTIPNVEDIMLLLVMPFCTIAIMAALYYGSSKLFYEQWAGGMVEWMKRLRRTNPNDSGEWTVLIFEWMALSFTAFIWLGIVFFEVYGFVNAINSLINDGLGDGSILLLIGICSALIGPVVVKFFTAVLKQLGADMETVKKWTEVLLKAVVGGSLLLILPFFVWAVAIMIYIAGEAFAQGPEAIKYLIDELPKPPSKFEDYLEWFFTIIYVVGGSVMILGVYATDIALIIVTVTELLHINSENWMFIFALAAEVDFLWPLVKRILGYRGDSGGDDYSSKFQRLLIFKRRQTVAAEISADQKLPPV